jgi:hypothetical protein
VTSKQGGRGKELLLLLLSDKSSLEIKDWKQLVLREQDEAAAAHRK